jgi:Holliday junction resolvase-like predicted endonuclease
MAPEASPQVPRGLASGDDYEPEDNIHPWKIKRLSRAIETYLLEKRIGDEAEWQVDSISVYLNPEQDLIKIEHLEDIF